MNKVVLTLEIKDIDETVDQLLVAKVKHLLRNDDHIKKLIEDTVDREITRKIKSSCSETFIKGRIDRNMPKQHELYSVAYKEVVRLVTNSIKPIEQDLTSLLADEIAAAKRGDEDAYPAVEPKCGPISMKEVMDKKREEVSIKLLGDMVAGENNLTPFKIYELPKIALEMTDKLLTLLGEQTANVQ